MSVLLVVWYHVVGSLRYEGASASLLEMTTDWDHRLRASLPMSFFVSGLLATRTIRRPGDAFWRYLVERLLYPYVLWTVISVMLSVYVGRGEVNRKLRPDDLLLIAWRPILQYWYLLALVIYLVASRLLSRFDSRLRSLLVLVAIAWFALALGIGAHSDFAQMLELHLGFFCAGLLFGTTVVAAVARRGDTVLLALSLSGLAAIVAIMSSSGERWGWDMLPALAGFVIIFTFLPLSLLVARYEPHSWLGHVGARSMEIYVVHVIAAAAARIGLFQLGISSLPVHLVVGMLAGVLVPLVIAVEVERYHLPSPFRLSLRWPLLSGARAS